MFFYHPSATVGVTVIMINICVSIIIIPIIINTIIINIIVINQYRGTPTARNPLHKRNLLVVTLEAKPYGCNQDLEYL